MKLTLDSNVEKTNILVVENVKVNNVLLYIQQITN